jgi:hypothetical protein
MSESDPVRIYVSHMFTDHPDYHRVFEYLESVENFFYINCSNPESLPDSGGLEAIKNTLLDQIRSAEIFVLISTMFAENQNLISFEMDAAEAADVPIVALEPFGGLGTVPAEIQARCTETVEWNDRTMVDTILRVARDEDTHRWEVIEFDLS